VDATFVVDTIYFHGILSFVKWLLSFDIWGVVFF
jgi:hypothetical protein